MEQYTIYCTEEQTKKAMELGAPIELEGEIYYPNGAAYPKRPTSEQMIGWLEECEEIDEIVLMKSEDNWAYIVFTGLRPNIEMVWHASYLTRKEATLAAIDVALDYLIKTKK